MPTSSPSVSASSIVANATDWSRRYTKWPDSRGDARRRAVERLCGSSRSTKLKVTGVDLFSAVIFAPRDETDEIVLRDPSRGVYKRIVLRDNRVVGAVLYGDTADGSWYFDLLRKNTDITSIHDTLIFGQAYQGGASLDPRAAAAAAGRCGNLRLQRRLQGTITQAITVKGLTTLDEVRAQTKASSSCGQCTSKVETLLSMVLGDNIPPSAASRCVKCIDLTHEEVRGFILSKELRSLPAVMQELGWKPRAAARPAALPSIIICCAHGREYRDDAQSRFRQRARPRQHPERTAHSPSSRACGAVDDTN